MSELRSRLSKEFQDEDYRYAYAEGLLNSWIAAQIKVIREQRGLTQAGLAQRIGTKQAGVSRLENVNYTGWKTETLRKVARALGVRLRISFETFGTLLGEAERFNKRSLERPLFEADETFRSRNVTQPNLVACSDGPTTPNWEQVPRTSPTAPTTPSISEAPKPRPPGPPKQSVTWWSLSGNASGQAGAPL